MIYRYTGSHYEDDEGAPGWIAVLGEAHWTKDQLRKALAVETNEEQRAELEKALALTPDDNVLPKRGQRRKVDPAD